MTDDVRILTQRETNKPDAGGRYRTVIETAFNVGDDGPFYVNQPEEGFDPQRQAELIITKAAAVRAARAGVRG